MAIPATSLLIQHIRELADTSPEVVRLWPVEPTVELTLVWLSVASNLSGTIEREPGCFLSS